MNRKQDKRNLNTKLELAKAFKDLSKTKEMNKITVSDLIKYCNINRNTFYYHFQDIYELINWIFYEEIKNIIDSFDKTEPETFLNKIFDYIETNKHILNSAYQAFTQEQLQEILHPYFYTILNTVITKHIKNKNVIIDDSYKNFLIDFYSAGFVSSIVAYFKGSLKIDRASLIRYLLLLIDSIL